jgi:hypothetical protein
MYMLGLQNAQERTLDDWNSLFKDTDLRFKVVKISKPSQSYLSVMEVIWEG